MKDCLRLRDEFAQFPSASRATGVYCQAARAKLSGAKYYARATANEDSGAAPVILDQQTVFERLCYSYKIDDTTTIADAKSLLPAAIQMRGDTVNIPMFVAPDVALLVALICVAYQRGLSEHTAVKEAVAGLTNTQDATGMGQDWF